MFPVDFKNDINACFVAKLLCPSQLFPHIMSFTEKFIKTFNSVPKKICIQILYCSVLLVLDNILDMKMINRQFRNVLLFGQNLCRLNQI